MGFEGQAEEIQKEEVMKKITTYVIAFICLFMFFSAEAQSSGQLVVTIEYDHEQTIDPGGQWRIDEGPWLASGPYPGPLAAGTYWVEFKEVPGWTTPSPSPREVGVVNDKTTLISVEYIQQFGSLQVTIEPPGAILAGAQWRRGGTIEWQNSGTIEEEVPVGPQTVEFKEIPGWATPARGSSISS